MAYEVTIGIPVYNVEKYIRRSMDSALAQTFQSIEFLVCDDCGTDSSMDIIREYQHIHPRGKDIRIVRQQQNGGIGNARNRILDEATGKYLFFLDSDDAIIPNAIELLYENAKRYNAQIVYGSYERIEELGDQIKHIPFHYPSVQFLKEDEFAKYAYRRYEGIQATTWNFLIDIAVYRKNALRYMPINFWEDFTFVMVLPIFISRAVLLPDITYHYYVYFGSLSHLREREHVEKSEIKTVVDSLEVVKNRSCYYRRKEYFSKMVYKIMMTDLYVVCNILKNRRIISPDFSNKELQNIMKSPLTILEILKLREWRLRNFALWLLSKLPSRLSVILIEIVGKSKGLI